MVFNATFDNISVISWRSVLLVEETGVPRENHHAWAEFDSSVANHDLKNFTNVIQILLKQMHFSK
jgi:hypothetical protein